ncbi:MAG: hypothetical protein Q8P18_16280 [Pseudomonadota bacterium]|nr:hypothetical protein [Pseudomonadota bacterium]
MLHDSTAPVKRGGAERPAESELFVERAAVPDESHEEWSWIDSQYGTVEEPYTSAAIDPRSLYADDCGPVVEDIQQGQIGDCYLLAALTSIVGKDPGVVQGMMLLGNGTVAVNFFRYDSTASAWVPVTIAVSTALLHAKGADGSAGALVSAGVRCGETPSSGSWYADVTDTELSINADFVYPSSAWVPLLEKAYAQYVELYGQYGGAPGTAQHENKATDDAGNPLSGYEILDGGIEEFVYRLFYGDAVKKEEAVGVQYTPGAELVSQNDYIVWALLRARETDGARDVHVTASMDEDAAVERLDAEVGHALGQPWMDDYGTAFSGMLQQMRDAIAAWRVAPDKKAAIEQIAARAAHAVKPGHWPVLAGDREEGGFRGLQELLLIANHLGKDHGGDQRHTYADHAYSVLGASFSDADGQTLAVTSKNYQALLAQIDPAASEVELRNPHGGYEPNASGDAQEDDGTFSLTLEQFIRSFATINLASVAS